MSFPSWPRERTAACPDAVLDTRQAADSLDSHSNQPKRLSPCSDVEDPCPTAEEESSDGCGCRRRVQVERRRLPPVPSFLDLRVHVIDGAPAVRDVRRVRKRERTETGQGRRQRLGGRNGRAHELPYERRSADTH